MADDNIHENSIQSSSRRRHETKCDQLQFRRDQLQWIYALDAGDASHCKEDGEDMAKDSEVSSAPATRVQCDVLQHCGEAEPSQAECKEAGDVMATSSETASASSDPGERNVLQRCPWRKDWVTPAGDH